MQPNSESWSHRISLVENKLGKGYLDWRGKADFICASRNDIQRTRDRFLFFRLRGPRNENSSCNESDKISFEPDRREKNGTGTRYVTICQLWRVKDGEAQRCGRAARDAALYQTSARNAIFGFSSVHARCISARIDSDKDRAFWVSPEAIANSYPARATSYISEYLQRPASSFHPRQHSETPPVSQTASNFGRVLSVDRSSFLEQILTEISFALPLKKNHLLHLTPKVLMEKNANKRYKLSWKEDLFKIRD